MKILVCVKPVPDPETRLRVSADKLTFDSEGVKFTLSGYDESAVEQALLLKESIPNSTVRAITFAVAGRGEEPLRAALALGADTATLVEAPPNRPLEGIDSARALSFWAMAHPAQLYLLGKSAADTQGGMLPTALAMTLGIPGFSNVIDLRWDSTTSQFHFGRSVEKGTERWEVPPPIVIGLQQAWNDPRTAKLPNILKSRRQPIDKVAVTEVLPHLLSHPRRTPREFRLPPPRTGAKLIDYKTPQDAAEKLVRLLQEEAKVFP